jgi:hypothetical protein
MPVGQAGADRCGGLIQFSDAQFLHPERIARARLRLLLLRARSRASILTAQANEEPFDPRCVTWVTRPAVQPRPRVDLLADAAWAGEYIEYDVATLLPSHSACFGLTLSTRPGQNDAAVFSIGECAPPILSVSVRDDPAPEHGFNITGLFRQHTFHLEGEGQAHSPQVAMDDAERITVFAKNTGVQDLTFDLQISPDGEDFLDDPQSVSVASGKTMSLTPYFFARYLRARVTSPGGFPVDATLTFQVQTRTYHAQ